MRPPRSAPRPRDVRAVLRHPWVRHLRLPFNLFLAPLFLWGALLARGPGATGTPLELVVAFLALHVFLYGGTNAFNSYYDRDEGPIGGMLEPPPVDRGLLAFSLAWQAAGLPLALAVNAPFAFAWLALFGVFTAYSHPLVRLKRDPALAMAAVGLGQGGVGFAAGWLALRPAPGSLASGAAPLGMVAATLVVVGLYVVTQSYQSAEDARRGDRTLPVLLGPRRALRLALAPLALGGGLLLALVWLRWGTAWGAPLALVLAALGGWLLVWSGRFDAADVAGEFRRTMRFIAVASGLLTGFGLLVGAFG